MSRPADYYDDKTMPLWAGLIPWLRGQRGEPADADQCRIAADTIEALDDRVKERDAEIAWLRAALEAFADLGDNSWYGTEFHNIRIPGGLIHPRDFARKALEPEP